MNKIPYIIDPCSVEGCDNDARTRGLCPKHYQRMRQHGTTDRPAETDNCNHCGTEFTKRNTRHVFCSKKCVDANKINNPKLTCHVCDGPMLKSITSRPQGEARHKRCSPFPHTQVPGHMRGCQCLDCKQVKSEYMVAYREWYTAQHGVNPSTPARRKRRQEGAYQYSEGVPGAVRARVYERDGGTCQICGYPTEQEGGPNSDTYPSVDHITPRSQGGTHTTDNLRTVHRRCNSLRADNKRTDTEVRAIVLGRTA